MGTITGLTAARMLDIEAASVIGGSISGDNLILTKHNGDTINAGNVRGPQGPAGATGPTGPSGAASFVSTLPSSPTDGQEIIYQSTAMAAANVAWRLKYKASAPGSYKWLFIGGAPLSSEWTNGTTGLLVPSTYTTVTSVSCPLAGTYDIEYGSIAQDNNAGSLYYYTSLVDTVGPTTLTDNWNSPWAKLAGGWDDVDGHDKTRKTRTSPPTFGVQVRGSVNNVSKVYRAYVHATPVAVG